MVIRDDEERAIVKGSVPRSLKLQFKVLCIEKELEMSSVLECLIKKWLQIDAPITNASDSSDQSDRLDEALEDVKGYIPKSLKIQFKIRCAQKRVKIRVVLCKLIDTWVQAGGPTSSNCSQDVCRDWALSSH